jgi:hypothetical protein
VLVNAVIYRNGFVKARSGSVYKHFSVFYHLTVVNAMIYQSSGFYNDIYMNHLLVCPEMWPQNVESDAAAKRGTDYDRKSTCLIN